MNIPDNGTPQAIPEVGTTRRRRVAVWAYKIRGELIESLRNLGFEVAVVFNGSSPSAVSFSPYELFYGINLPDHETGPADAARASDEFLRDYSDCISRLSFIPHTREPIYLALGAVGSDNLVDWSNLHRRAFRNILLTHQIEEVWIFNVPHLGLDNALEYESRRLGLVTLVFRQSPIAGKFFYSSSPARTIAPFQLEFTPHTAGAVQPDLFYMPGMTGPLNTVFEQMFDRVKFVLRVVFGVERSAAWSRVYNACWRRGWGVALLALDLSSSLTREVALLRFTRRRRFRRDLKGRRFIESGSDRGAYVYFALHNEPEASTSALGGDYSNQVDAIAALSGLLPTGWRILVKENPKQGFMFRDSPFFMRIRGLSRVYFVNDQEASSKLIDGAAIVATINGTAGYEALLFGKPCVYFGDAWYEGFPGAFRFCADIDLEEISGFSVDAKALASAVNGRISAAADGLIYMRSSALLEPPIDWNMVCNTTALSLARISRVASGME